MRFIAILILTAIIPAIAAIAAPATPVLAAPATPVAPAPATPVVVTTEKEVNFITPMNLSRRSVMEERQHCHKVLTSLTALERAEKHGARAYTLARAKTRKALCPERKRECIEEHQLILTRKWYPHWDHTAPIKDWCQKVLRINRG
ncbi:hypothetical protein KKG22_03600 [Patescibacteria group bacterium]|nr:hypothetical protein [Patescibacteria group bacterium]MBU1721234.1 hypothetical protein [Patescibacteria group bacterium]MBU1901058.1 hypothetical protein [Patescibacteria group bacterium]